MGHGRQTATVGHYRGRQAEGGGRHHEGRGSCPPKPEPAPAELEWKELQVAQQVAPSTDGRIRELYTEALLDILKQEGSSTSEQVLLRLDKLAGIA